MYTHVIFDLDGTLLNTIDDLANAGNWVCTQRGWPTHTVEAYKTKVGNGIPKLVERFAPQGTSQEELEEALAQFMDYYGAHKEDLTAPYWGMAQVLDALKQAGVGIGVLTNKAHSLAGAVMERYYPGVFTHIQGALPDQPTKPDPTLLYALMEQMGAKPDTTLFVGDSNVDIRTGKNGKLDTCGVLWGFRSRAELEQEGAHHLVERPGQLLSLVLGRPETQTLPPHEVEAAAKLLAQGQLVAVPTETVYGLASDAYIEESVRANYEAKGRPEEKPLNVLVDGMDMVEGVCRDIPTEAYILAKAFWPGPLTMILWGKGTLPSIVPAGGTTQGVRCPDHPDTLGVIRALGHPLACPSANISGHPSPKNAQQVLEQLDGRIGAVLDGGPCSVGVESTIVNLTVKPFRILRQGGLSREAIEQALGCEVEG